MHADAASSDVRTSVLTAWDRTLVEWPATEGFAHAVAETASHHGYAPADVDAQLRHVILRARGRTMQLVVEQELSGDDLVGAPERVLVLATGRMPGLVLEGIAAALAVGATALVRPSGDETVLHHLLGGLQAREPELMSRVEVVGTAGDAVPWHACDAAIVFGSDETIAFVRSQLTPAAATRIAAYGSRQGIAIVTPGANDEPGWARCLADDVLAFRQMGCMSPSWLFLVGDATTTRTLREAIGRELALARERHVAAGVDVGMQQRHASDADVLGSIAAGMAPGSAELYAGDARLTIVPVRGVEELIPRVSALGSLLQTAVIASSPEERAAYSVRLLRDTGVTRVCRPGQAHEPDPLWPQDGIGRVAPLLGR